MLAALTVARRIGLDDLLPRRGPQRRHDLALAWIVARLLDPAPKLATARMLDPATDLELRPVFHWTVTRVRTHVLLCMLAYYLEWHMRQPLAPMLFDNHNRASADAERPSPVATAKVSKAASRKASTQQVDGGDLHPAHSLRTLLGDLATLTRNTVCFGTEKTLTVHAAPTPVQRRAFSLPRVELAAA